MVFCAMLVVRVASAEDSDAREHARALAMDGDQLFARGRCDQAIERWTEADASYHAPTIVVRIARCEALLGRVVQAATALESIVAEAPAAGEGDAFRIAREDAARELPVIRARIAHLVVAVDGTGAGEARAEIDGHAVEVGTSVAVDPGPHDVRVTSASSTWSRRERVVDGETRTVRVGVLQHASLETRSGGRTLGFIVGGTGMAAMAAGAAFGVASVTLSHTLFDRCGPQGNTCPPGEQGQIDALKRDAFVSDLALGTGAALFLTGAIVIVTEKLTRSEGPVQVELVGTGVSIHGWF
jgi:hypothetical protein